MKHIYIAGPLTADSHWQVERNIRAAEWWILPLMARGVVPVCPHTMYRHHFGARTPQDWYDVTMCLLERCDGIVLGARWRTSSGSVAEEMRAQQLGLAVFGKVPKARGHVLREIRAWATSE